MLAVGYICAGNGYYTRNFVYPDQHITVDGKDRLYKVVVPDNFDTHKDFPVIIVIHSLSSSADYVAKATKFYTFGPENGYVVAFV